MSSSPCASAAAWEPRGCSKCCRATGSASSAAAPRFSGRARLSLPFAHWFAERHDLTKRGGEAKFPALVLTTCILASSLSFIDGSVLNVALPAIGQSFDAHTAEVQWVMDAFTLPLSALLLLGGAAGYL